MSGVADQWEISQFTAWFPAPRSKLDPDLAKIAHTLPLNPTHSAEIYRNNNTSSKKERTLTTAKTPRREKDAAFRRHGSSGLGGARYLVGVVVGVGVGAGGGVGSGASADKDLEAAVLGPRHGGQIARSCRAADAAASGKQSVSQSGVQLWGARAFLESGSGAGRQAAPSTLQRSCAAPLVCLRLRTSLCTAFLYFGRLLGPSAAFTPCDFLYHGKINVLSLNIPLWVN